MEGLSPFETQRSSVWFNNMLTEHEFGYHEYSWQQRALMALNVSGCEGRTMTTMEIHDAVAPYVGAQSSSLPRSYMIAMGLRNGIIQHSEEKRRYGEDRLLTSYEVSGHLEPRDGMFRGQPRSEAVMMEGL